MYTADATQMHAIRLKAAMQIHAQKKKGGMLTADDVLNESEKDMASIVDGDAYYAGFTSFTGRALRA